MASDPHIRRSRPAPTSPRRVVGGIKPTRLEPDARLWPAQRWLRIVDHIADAAALRDGLEYADLGQARSVALQPGVITASVQGPPYRPFTAVLRVPVLDAGAWDSVTDAVLEDSALSGALLAGDLPKRIEDVFTPVGVPLVPVSPDEITPECSCGVPNGRWCAHTVCALRLAADLLHTNPLAAIRLRGRDPDEFLDRLRRRRAVQGSVVGISPAYQIRVDLPESCIPPRLENAIENFWRGDTREIDSLDTTPDPPVPSHALLRRLGPSPMEGARFPLVGLLASCYDRIAEDATADPDAGPPAD